MRSRIDSSKRYLLAGLSTNLFAYLLFCMIQFSTNPTSPVFSFLVSASLVLPISFLINKKWVFQSAQVAKLEFMKFSATYFGAIALGLITLTFLYPAIPNPYFAQLTNVFLVGSSTFLMHSFWTFNSKN